MLFHRILLLTMLFGAVRPAFGVEVRNITTGVTLFDSAGFENDALNAAPAAASPGSWVAYPPLDFVTNAVSPGPATGSKYLATARNASTSGGPRAFFASQEIPGQHIRMSFMLRVPSAVDAALVLENNATFYRGLGRITGGRYYNYNGSAYVDSGLTYTANTWQRWDIDYIIGASTYGVTVAGNSVSVPTLNGLSTQGAGSIYAVSFGHNGYQTYHIDAAPPVLPPAPANDDCGDAQLVSEGTVGASTVSATAEGSGSCGNSAGSPDVWYRYTAGFDGAIVVDTCGSSFDTVLSVYEGSVCPVTPERELACNDDCTGSTCGGPDSCVTVPVSAGHSYLIRAAGAGGASGDLLLSIREIKQMLVDWQVGPDLPQGLQDSDGGVIENTLVTVGGFCSGIPGDQAIKPGVYPRGFLKKAWGLDLSNRAAGWQTLPDFPGVARQGLSAAKVGNALYFWGGFNYTAPYTYEDGYRLRRLQGNWVWDQLPSLPWRLTSSALAVIGTRIYAIGGADYDGETGFFTETDRYGGNARLGAHILMLDTLNLAGGWQQLADCPGTPRFVHAAATAGGKIFVIGGATGTSPTCTVVDNWMFDPIVEMWTRVSDTPVSSGNFPRGSELAYADRFVILPGGYNYGCVANPDGSTGPSYGTLHSHPDQPYTYGVFYNDAFVYDTMTDTFGSTNLLPLNNNLPMTVVHGEEVFQIGGETGGASLYGEYYGHHPELCLVGSVTPLVPMHVRPDFDRDWDVDLVDFAHLQGCYTDDPAGELPLSCLNADVDEDGRVDELDFAILRGCLSGADVPAVLNCEPE